MLYTRYRIVGVVWNSSGS